ncbi:hypothetical protein E2320_014422 [Naja naja]|nr:hypothetical protein E2320_014422 [Naja naja]
MGSSLHLNFMVVFFMGALYVTSPQDFNSLLDSTYGMLYARTRTREDYLKSEGYVVRCIWEHEWNDMLKNSEGLKHFLADQMPFLGVEQTPPVCTINRSKGSKSYDFTSLYPYVNKNKAYPIRHPEIIPKFWGYKAIFWIC